MAAHRPDIIVVVCDDLGYGDLGCYGSSSIETPRLDGLASEGARFTSMYSAAPTCTPSRAGLLTGREAVHVGLPRVLRPGDEGCLAQEVPTLADLARAEGYRTACVGKWHLGALPRHGPLEHGFDTYFGMPYSNDMPPLNVWRDTEVLEETADVTSLTRRYTAEAVDIIDGADAHPLFLYLAFAMPHHPVAPEPGFAGTSRAGAYGDVVEAIDHYVGTLQDALRRRGTWRDTLFVFTSDHGPRFDGSTAGLRGRKFETYEGGMRVPFLMAWPERIHPGTVVDRPASGLDLLPTIATALEWSLPSDLDGEALPLLGPDSPTERRPIFFYDEDELNAVRAGRWKLHQRRHTWGGRDRNAHLSLPQLFDLDVDPAESYDIACSHPEVVRRLSEVMERERSRSTVHSPA